ncbi:hypothetical protein COV13_02970 [Candidatus Woesearchaeota archaeon CG10_big_fil_rev_8_21_14_0_10_32_9]|nr:MAG: hypothetical protein COV13_02970 [Candidatus Woesearchaeota archaeon CG10_big_fil_rev_8_21_14_0_10_32_9]
MEYLSIISIALLILIPSTMLFLNYSKSTTDTITSGQLNLIGTTLQNKAEEMYVVGKGSWVTLEFSFPQSFQEAGINTGNELYFTYSTAKGVSQVVFFFDRFNITSITNTSCSTYCNLNFSEGINKIKIESNGSQVIVKKV